MNRFFLLAILVFFTNSIFATEFDLLSPTQKNLFNTKNKIIKEEKKVNQKSWLSDININTTINKDEDDVTSKNLSLSFEQDIFKFGAILNTINLAKIQEQYDLLNLDITFNDYINTIYTNVLNIYLSDLNIKKQNLSIKNKAISLEIIKQEYKTGQTDVTELNDAIIEINSLEKELVDLEKNRFENILILATYTPLDYKNITIPKLKNQELSKYLEISKDIQLARHNESISKLTYKVKKTDYLPTLALTSNYNHNFSLTEEGNTYSYGLRLSMPINFSSSNEKQKYKLEYLLSKKEKEQVIIEETSQYHKIMKNIQKYSKLYKIALKDISLYDELLINVNAEYKAGYKALEDVEILSNTRKTRELDLKINNLYIQKEYIGLLF